MLMKPLGYCLIFSLTNIDTSFPVPNPINSYCRCRNVIKLSAPKSELVFIRSAHDLDSLLRYLWHAIQTLALP